MIQKFTLPCVFDPTKSKEKWLITTAKKMDIEKFSLGC